MKVPCWICKGQGITERGEFVDVGVGDGVQVSADLECGLCNGECLIEIGSKQHKYYRKFCMNV